MSDISSLAREPIDGWLSYEAVFTCAKAVFVDTFQVPEV
jgi:hypothetical protein